jgi:antitoxin PrlF
MRRRATVTSKGQITIPKDVRARLGLHKGDRVEFVVEDDRAFVRPVPDEPVPFRAYSCALGAFADDRDLDRWIAELRDEG